MGQNDSVDVRWGLPIRSDIVSFIHCEHFLEHLEYPNDARTFLQECFRALRPGGEFRLIVPDANKYISAYATRDKNFWLSLSDLGGATEKFSTVVEIMNQAFRMGGEHRFAYDKKTLSHILYQAGVKKIEESNYSPKDKIDLGDSWRLTESLYVTAEK